MSLWKYSQREIVGRPGRTILTLLSIVIGVGTAVSVSLSTEAAKQATRNMVTTVSGHGALEVVSLDGKRFEPEISNLVADVPGIVSADPIVRQGTKLYFGTNKKVKLLAVGMDFDPASPPADMELVEGKFPEEPDECVLNANLASGAGIKVGDQVKLLVRRSGWHISLPEFKVVGLVSLPVSASFGGSGGLFLTLDGIRELAPGKLMLDTVSIGVDENASLPKLMAKVQKVLPEGLTCRKPPGGAEVAEETLRSVQKGLDFASTLSLAMAAFIILNTFLMNLSERRRSLAVMRAVGATRKQIVRMMLREGLAMGIVGTMLGVPVGIIGAKLLMKVMEGVLLQPIPALHVTLTAVVVAIVLGPVVSVIATVLPARRAGKVSPLEVMNPVSSGDIERFPVRITILAMITWVVCLVLTTGGLYRWLPQWVMIPSGVLMLIAFVLLIPVILGPFAELISWIGRPIMGTEGFLATRQLLRKRIRTTLTISVLIVAVSNGIGIGNTVITNIQDVKDWQRRVFFADFFLNPAPATGADTLTAEQTVEVLKKVRAIPGVEHVETVRMLNGKAGGMPAKIIARDFAQSTELPFDAGAGDPAKVKEAITKGEAVIGTVLAMRTGLKPGDEITVEAASQNARIRIAGLTDDYLTGGLVVYLDTDVARKILNIDGADMLLIKGDPKQAAGIQAALAPIAEDYSLLLRVFADLENKLNGILGGVVGCFWGLLALGFIVASFGIVNTLTMNVLEQTRELGLLRAVGMTRGQIRKMMLCQAAILGVIGAVLGALAGVTSAYMIGIGNQPLLGHPVEFKLHVGMVMMCLIGAFLLVTAAGFFPSRRASRLNLLEALSYE